MTDGSGTRGGAGGSKGPRGERPAQPKGRTRSHEGAAKLNRPLTSADPPDEARLHDDDAGFHGGSDRRGDTDDRGGYDGMTTDHNKQRIEEADENLKPAPGESSGVESIDRLNEGVRQVLGDPQVDYSEAEFYMEPDDSAIDAAAKVHGDRVERQSDGTHEVQSVATGPADDPSGGWADKPVGRKGDRVFTQDADEAEELRRRWGESD